MCGIVGIIDPHGRISETDLTQLQKNVRTLRHRGPDHFGYWSDGYFAIAHAKLSIFNPGINSNQPFISPQAVVACNGEIYNYRDLANELNVDPRALKSDCEIILKGYEAWGPDIIAKLRGDFALALYDPTKKLSLIARDHVGVKQLLYAQLGDVIIFASEAKALQNLRDFNLKISMDKIAEDWLMGFWGDKLDSYFRSVRHLEQGTWLQATPTQKPLIKNYWTPLSIPTSEITITETIESCDAALRKAMHEQLTGDALVGTLLSGGLDSSLTTALAASYMPQVNAYTTTYNDAAENIDYDHAKLVTNKYTNINHIQVNNRADDFNIESLSRTSYHMEEVIWDRVYWAILKNYEMAAKDKRRVMISGQGSDDLWLGYFFTFPHYRVCGGQWTASFLINEFSQMLLQFSGFLNPNFLNPHRARDIMASNIERNLLPYNRKDTLNGIAHWAFRTHLQSNLMQEDRLSMASSVECRVPHLDLNLVTLAYSTRSCFKLYDGREKYPIRKLAARLLPSKVAERNKYHFPESPSSYNKHISTWLSRQSALFKNSQILPEIFNQQTLSDLLNNQDALNSSLIWRAAAIANFEQVFTSNIEA